MEVAKKGYLDFLSIVGDLVYKGLFDEVLILLSRI